MEVAHIYTLHSQSLLALGAPSYQQCKEAAARYPVIKSKTMLAIMLQQVLLQAGQIPLRENLALRLGLKESESPKAVARRIKVRPQAAGRRGRP